MKKLLFTACLLFTGLLANAQNIFEVKDISQPNDVYSSADNEAAIIIRCSSSIPLTFSSTMDKSADPFRTEIQGSDSVYYIAFPTGSRYRGRQLTVNSPGYIPVEIPLELEPKQLLSFKITDPNALVDAGCYREHRNKGIEEVKNSNYEEARNQFIVARECTDCDQVENEANIAKMDSLIYYRQKGDEAYRLLDYVTASSFYSKVVSENPYDTYATNRNTTCIQNFIDDCSSMFTRAEFYFNEKQYDKAKELYEKVVNNRCKDKALATQRLSDINSAELSKKDHARVLTYEIRKDVPIGISYGKYNMHKAGGFFQMDLNSKVFEAAREDCKYGDEKFAEANIAFGWTIKIINPVWIHFGPGFTAKMYYGTYKKKNYPKVGYGKAEQELLDTDKMGEDLEPKEKIDEKYEDAWKKANFAGAISPVIGITAKYSYFALRLTYQYRWSLKSEQADFIGKSRFSVGIGVAF